jgi:predicted protein tyrosine phosphatase
MKVLFVCNQGKHRSRTAEQLFKGEFETRAAGLYSESPVSAQDLAWADTIVVMEEHQRKELVARFPQECLQKRLVTLNVPDVYQFQQPELVETLKARVASAMEITS